MAKPRRLSSHGWLPVLFSIGVVFGLFATAAGSPSCADEPKEKTGGPTVEEVLRKASSFFRKAQSVSVVTERSQNVGPLSMRSTFTMAMHRPNQLAVRIKGDGPAGMGVVSDGKTLHIWIEALRKYSEAPAPASLADLAADPIVQGLVFQSSVLGNFLADDPYKALMEGVNKASYAGLDTLDGGKAHHLKFTQDQFDWELWVAAEGDPVVLRTTMDLSKSVANMPGAAQLKNQKIEIIQECKDWKFDQKPDEKTFVFTPPPGVQKADNLLGDAGGDEDAPSPLVGAPAPDVSLKLLEKGEFRLDKHRDAHVVMLDFWATWCGPCVQELPILAEVAKSYKEKGVVFCAVNQAEESDEIRKFLKAKKLDITVALDPDGETGKAYQARAIPMLVLIDKKGVVQSVHIGYSPTIKTTLQKELDALLEGKSLAKEVSRNGKPADLKAEGLELAWTARGGYSGVTADASGRRVYALGSRGRCDVIDAAGKTVRSARLAGAGAQTTARFARWGKAGDGLVSFHTWGPSVLASKSDGSKLWEETEGQGVDDVWAADLDGDGSDEVIVGYNGSTGLHVFSAAGKRLWSRTELGNVWHVTAGDTDGDGKLEVVTTSAQGKVHVFAANDGHPLRTLDAGLYANMVRVGHDRANKRNLILVAGMAGKGNVLAALGDQGKPLWTVPLPAAPQCASLAVSPEGTWAAAGLQGGRVCVVELAGGRIVAQVEGQGRSPETAWATPEGASEPRLLVATGNVLNAFRVKPSDGR